MLAINYTANSSAWSVIWSFITSFFTSVKSVMGSITIFSIGTSFHCSLWDFCLAIIIMGSIIGQFIIFAKPVLPDQPTSNWIEDKANRRFRRSEISSRRKG